MSDEMPDHIACKHTAALTPEQKAKAETEAKAFCDYLARLDPPRSVDFYQGALWGIIMREHFDIAHPAEVEWMAATGWGEGDKREGWLLGFRFVERNRGDNAATKDEQQERANDA